jgi:hypothetical protein
MIKTSGFSIVAAPLLAFALILPSHAADSTNPTTCKDGTTSAATGKGACSGHGGVQKAPKTTGAATAPAPAPAPEPAAAAPGGGATTCKDGTTSAATGKGACSSHGGVQKAAAKPAAAAPAAAAPSAATSAPAAAAPAATAAKSAPAATKSAPTASAGNTDPTGATAKCKDGTYSKSQHRSGTCSSHGGVAEWLTSAQ